MKYLWKKRKAKRSLRIILFIYRYMQLYIVTSAGNSALLKLYYMIIHISLPTRQHFFNFFNLTVQKSYNYSSGVLLKLADYNVKFYKRTHNCAATLALFFKSHYLGWWSSIYLLVIKNFNYRQISLYKKLNTLIKLNIYYLLHNRPFITNVFPKRRIKRRIVRLIGAQ